MSSTYIPYSLSGWIPHLAARRFLPPPYPARARIRRDVSGSGSVHRVRPSDNRRRTRSVSPSIRGPKAIGATGSLIRHGPARSWRSRRERCETFDSTRRRSKPSRTRSLVLVRRRPARTSPRVPAASIDLGRPGRYDRQAGALAEMFAANDRAREDAAEAG